MIPQPVIILPSTSTSTSSDNYHQNVTIDNTGNTNENLQPILQMA